MKLNLLDKDFDDFFDNFWLLSKEQIGNNGLASLVRRRLLEEEIKHSLSEENSAVVRSIRQGIKAKHNLAVTSMEVIEAAESLLYGRKTKAKLSADQAISLKSAPLDDYKWVELSDLYTAGIVSSELPLTANYKDHSFRAKLTNQGILVNDTIYKSPSKAGGIVTGKPTNGWDFWKFIDADGKSQRLKILREKLPNLLLTDSGFYKWKP